MAGTATPATALLVRQRIPHSLHPYDVPPTTPNYGLVVAAALGVGPELVFKTLIVEVDGRLHTAVVPVAEELDLKALAAAAGGKRAGLADRAIAERVTGYVRGGISPLGQRRRLCTVVDSTAEGLSALYISAGRRGLQLRMSAMDLVRLTAATVAPIAAR
ncbi:MAG TPA: Cys-tRNA(Pro) deacylase [Micromonosporaceae bacterium]|nr:Cys-tRNA(Pro) deacylase [Micromonosporaceae bacterium]